MVECGPLPDFSGSDGPRLIGLLAHRTEREVAMATRAVDGSILFAKKLGGVFAMLWAA